MRPYHHTPTQHNENEVFGVDYLYKQAGKEFDSATCEDSTQVDEIIMDDEVDEGFEDSSTLVANMSEDMETIGTGEAPTQDDELDASEGEEGDSMKKMMTMIIWN